MIRRKLTRRIQVGEAAIGGDAPVSIQSMTNTRTEDTEATVSQIRQLVNAGCDIVRVAVPDLKAAAAFGLIRQQVNVPLVADIHFDFRLALEAMKQGADKVRINPGNIGSKKRLDAVIFEAAERGLPLRIGVNGGSLEKKILEKHGGVTAAALVESALGHIRFCESRRFRDLVISVKTSDVMEMIEANRMLSEETDCPLHLGVTEAGSLRSGIIPSAVGIGTLLAEGIGDTVRISLTGDPVAEVKAAKEILRSLHLRPGGLRIISCPTCSRTHTDLEEIVEQVETALAGVEKNITVAIMGCEVNGPGEAKEADLGVACGKKSALLFHKGRAERKIAFDEIVTVLLQEVEKY